MTRAGGIGMPTCARCSPTATSTSSTAPWGRCSTARGSSSTSAIDELNLSQPDVVRDVHRDYVRAGAEVIETNTFGANPIKLAQYGLTADTETINTAAVRIARDAAGARAAVVGAIGPLGVRLEPFGETVARGGRGRRSPGRRPGSWPAASTASPRDLHRRRGTAQPPCDGVRARSDLPIIAQMTVGEDGRTYLRHGAVGLRPGARGDGRRRHRRQLLGRARTACSRRSSSSPRW